MLLFSHKSSSVVLMLGNSRYRREKLPNGPKKLQGSVMGRKKLYDRGDALSSIKRSFWQNGYEATSILDLEAATGLPKQTLYREFGDKEGMYAAALADYENEEIRGAAKLLRNQGTPVERFERLFSAILEQADTQIGRRGCFLCNAAVDRSDAESAASQRITHALTRLRDAFAQAMEVDPAERHSPDSLLASYMGLRTLIRNGWPVERLRGVVDEMLLFIAREPN